MTFGKKVENSRSISLHFNIIACFFYLTVASLLMILPPPETVTVASPGFSLEAATLSTLSVADFLSPVAGSIWKFLMVSSTDLQPSSGRNDLRMGIELSIQ